jgi:peptidoglycan/xylan/chitin deacetylase (PgdA/CDA1 family)
VADKKLTLTFDHGPTPGVTERVLDVLRERDLHATFFPTGSHPAEPGVRALAERVLAEGHRALARLGERDWNVLVAHDLPTGAMKDLPWLLDTVLDAGIEIVQEIPDHVTPVRRGFLADWVADVSSGQH